jgi:hypothetical protein
VNNSNRTCIKGKKHKAKLRGFSKWTGKFVNFGSQWTINWRAKKDYNEQLEAE